ncbi:MAG TPA: glycosyltransferase family 2 protein, partial [Clostridia bacterium]|nr:glycosyltransferase family 2 protein [Clostridia bacterium]
MTDKNAGFQNPDKPTKGLVSVVLPVYNCERYVAEAIESVRCQSYPHWELIAVDDCSTDRTAKILAEIAGSDSRIRFFRNDQNRKLPATLNRGFGEGRGEFFGWLGADDRYHPEALQQMVAA